MQACPGMCQALPCCWQGMILPGLMQRGFRGMSAAPGIIASTLTPHLARAAPHCAEHASRQPQSHHAASHSLQEGALDSAGVPCSQIIDLNPFCEVPAPGGAKHTLQAVIFYHNRHYIACCRRGEGWVAYNDQRMYLLSHELVRLADLGAPGLLGQISGRPAALPTHPCPACEVVSLAHRVCPRASAPGQQPCAVFQVRLTKPAGGATRMCISVHG